MAGRVTNPQTRTTALYRLKVKRESKETMQAMECEEVKGKAASPQAPKKKQFKMAELCAKLGQGIKKVSMTQLR